MNATAEQSFEAATPTSTGQPYNYPAADRGKSGARRGRALGLWATDGMGYGCDLMNRSRWRTVAFCGSFLMRQRCNSWFLPAISIPGDSARLTAGRIDQPAQCPSDTAAHRQLIDIIRHLAREPRARNSERKEAKSFCRGQADQCEFAQLARH